MVTRVAGDKEGNGDRGKSNGVGDKGGGQETATRVMAMVTMWAMGTLAGNEKGMGKGGKSMATSMRVAGEEEGKSGKAMAMATRVVGKHTATATTRAIVTKTREAGMEEGNGKGGKSNGNGNGKEDGSGEHRWQAMMTTTTTMATTVTTTTTMTTTALKTTTKMTVLTFPLLAKKHIVP